jgi:predicted ferric reductase
MRIEMAIDRFHYKPGQYLYINCPAISKHEWHPFTITSAPEEAIVSVHMRTRGDWTTGLRQLLNPENLKEVRERF